MKNNHKNILFLFTDQQRLDTIGCYGNGICRTTGIDTLAKEGVRFNNAFTPTAVCTPARASVLTGKWPLHHKIVNNLEASIAYPCRLESDKQTFTWYLKEAGYNLGHAGKWHADRISDLSEHQMEGVLMNGWAEPLEEPGYIEHMKKYGISEFKARDIIRGRFINGEPGKALAGVFEGSVEATHTYYLAEKTIELIRRYGADFHSSGKPFYISCHFFGPHMPYYIPEKYANLYDPQMVQLPEAFDEDFESKPSVQKIYSKHWSVDYFSRDTWKKLIAMYWGYITMIDEQIQRICDELRNQGLYQDTAVLFTTDHGSFEGNHRLNDKGPAMYDDIYHIPMTARIPWLDGVKGFLDEFVSLIDLAPTFLDIAGIERPGDMDGRSLLPVVTCKADNWRSEIFGQFFGHHFPYPQRMVRTHKYKLIVNPGDVNELYDLEKDPDELTNLIGRDGYKLIRRELYNMLYKHCKENKDKFFLWMESMYEFDSDYKPGLF